MLADTLTFSTTMQSKHQQSKHYLSKNPRSNILPHSMIDDAAPPMLRQTTPLSVSCCLPGLHGVGNLLSDSNFSISIVIIFKLRNLPCWLHSAAGLRPSSCGVATPAAAAAAPLQTCVHLLLASGPTGATAVRSNRNAAVSCARSAHRRCAHC